MLSAQRHTAGLVLITLGLIMIIAAAGASSRATSMHAKLVSAGTGWWADNAKAAPLGVLPSFVEPAPIQVREAYAFASAPDNHMLMQSLNCNCGCERGLAHKSLLSCYIERLLPSNLAIYSDHGVGCLTGQSEVRDAKEWRQQGRSPMEISRLINRKYAGIDSTETVSPDH